MQTKFLKPNNPLLKKIAEEVSGSQLNSPEIRNIAEVMLKIIKGEQKGHKKGVGLAAPQIGISKRIILVDIKADGKGKVGDLRISFPKENSLLAKLKVYINPKIIWKSKRAGEWYEGCYSTGRVCGIVSRPTSIKIQAFVLTPPRRTFKFVTEKHKGYVARIFQHEIDHLDGKVFVDHIKDPNKLHWVEEKEFPLYRNKQAWRNWPKKYPLPLA